MYLSFWYILKQREIFLQSSPIWISKVKHINFSREFATKVEFLKAIDLIPNLFKNRWHLEILDLKLLQQKTDNPNLIGFWGVRFVTKLVRIWYKTWDLVHKDKTINSSENILYKASTPKILLLARRGLWGLCWSFFNSLFNFC